ncbi:hypothetical protein [Ancylobacter amanitiformis]|uniref:Glycosyltransferase RgtA/B/C/D-like domain-containing protein n=1 Tax=Ancylobacter amanitiformis TaxID=217069 RepID=A0ABU0LWH5_9HYPH|nr:hypothetical protein [Ancylobacter amanitiformis]MDQ0513087.1 hypothetical protein [Ancylobacter amanitiformis]
MTSANGERGPADAALGGSHRRSHRRSLAHEIVIASGIVALFLAALVWMSGGVPGLPAILALWAGVLAVLMAGELLLAAAGAGIFAGRLALSLVCGFAACVTAQLFGVFVLGLPAPLCFLLFGGAVALTGALVLPRLPAGGGDAATDNVMLALAAGLVLFGFRDLVAVLPALVTQGVMLNTDGVIHAAQLAQFGDPLGFGRGSLLLADVPLGLYHYGYYLPAAAIMRLLDLTPLAAQAAMLVPLGVFLGACGAYALAASMGGSAAGLIAIGLLFALPDGAHLGIGNRFFGFQTVMLLEPGSGYAVGGALAALACFERGRRIGGWGMWILAAALVAVLFQLRAHVFILFAPVMALLWAGEIPALRRHRAALILAAGIAGLAGIAAVTAIPALHDAVAGFSNAPSFFLIALDTLGPTLREGLFHSLVETQGMGPALALGLLVTLAAILGVLLPAYLIILGLARLRRGTTGLDAFPLLLLAVYAALILLAPKAPFSDPNTEFQHRPLVLVYPVFAVFIAILAARWLRLDTKVAPPRVFVPAALAIAVLSVLPQAAGLYTAELMPAGLSNFIRRPTEPALVPTALAIRAASAPGMTLAVADIRAEDGNIDSCATLAGISGVPCFLSRPSTEAAVSPAQAALVAERLSVLDAIAHAADLGAARHLMGKAGISWYVVRGPGQPSFDPEGTGAELRNSFGALYRAPPP